MQQLKELPTNKLVELDSKILKNFVKPIIEFLAFFLHSVGM